MEEKYHFAGIDRAVSYGSERKLLRRYQSSTDRG